MTTRIGVVGTGSMGALHARVVAQHPDVRLGWVADPNDEVGQRVAERFETVWLPAPDLASVDAVIVAAPTQHHSSIAMEVIGSKKPMLLEKPLATTYADVVAIVEAARVGGTVLLCGFLERFNPAVRTAMEIARAPIRVAAVRHSPYSSRIRTGVASDLMIHDADMVLRMIGEQPVHVVGQYGRFSATSDADSEDVAEALALFPGGQIATLSASRMSQHKVRSVSITEMDRLIDVDLLRQSITVYRNVEGAGFDEEAGYSQQTIIEIPVVRHSGEPLVLQLEHFLSVMHGTADANVEIDTLLAPHEFIDRVSLSASQPRR